MHTYCLLGPTQTYLSLIEAASNRAVTTSDLYTGSEEEPLTLASNTATSTILKLPKVTFDEDDLNDATSSLTRTNSPAKNNVLNKTKEKQSTCPFSGVHLL